MNINLNKSKIKNYIIKKSNNKINYDSGHKK
jgi:hypothetical protein